jgi:F0F1-type ATP synthase assembly protein I
MAVLGKLIFAVLYTFVLGWLCSKGYKSLSWFLVLLPYVLILLTFFGLVSLTQKQMQHVQKISGQESPIKESLTAGGYFRHMGRGLKKAFS